MPKSINSRPASGNGNIVGLISWGYTWNNNLALGNVPGNAVFDKSANIRGKPAEAVLSWWYKRW